MTNTRIYYLYRDAGNWKTPSEVVVQGHITYDDIKSCLDEGRYFIASQVGLSDPQNEIKLSSECDHVFVELESDDIEPTDCLPTISLTADQLLRNFRLAASQGWDVHAANLRIGIPVNREDYERVLQAHSSIDHTS